MRRMRRSTHSRVRLRQVVLGCACVMVSCAAVAGSVFESPISLPLIDQSVSGTIYEGKLSRIDPKTIMQVLDPKSNGGNWSAGSPPHWKYRMFHYRLAFQSPIELGTMIATMDENYSAYVKGRTFRYLKPGATYPGDPEKEEDWETIPATFRTGFHGYTFPPGVKTRAVLYTEDRPLGSSRLNKWVFLRSRLHNVTPYCMGQGQQSYGAWWPMDIPHGREWHGAGTVGEDPVIKRAPVTEVDPSWFVLSLDKGMKPVAMRFRSNIEKYRLYTYVGDPDENPAVAPAESWERLSFTTVRQTGFAQGRYSSSGARVFTIDRPVRTRALKLLLEETSPRNSQVAAIHEWTVWEDLGNAEVPPPPPPEPPAPFAMEYEIERDADVTAVVDNPDGTRLRNIVAQTSRKVGTNAERWDLKDEQGNYVGIGTYRLRGIHAPPLELYYQHTFYPNVEMHSPESHPWGGGAKHGWTGNHGNNTGLSAVGDRLFIGTGGTEGGHGLIETTLDGQKIRGWSMGVSYLFTDGETLFTASGSSVGMLNAEKGRFEGGFSFTDENRRGDLVGMAAHEGKVYVACFSMPPYFDKALSLSHIDVEATLPKLLESYDPPGRDHLIPANPREDFMRIFRLTGEPAGLGDVGSLSYIPSTDWASHRQFVVLAFKRPMPLGSVVFPRIEDDEITMSVSVLKPDAPWPPNPKRNSDWILFDEPTDNAWEVLSAPENTLTRALRLTFAKAGEDGLLDDMDTSMETGGDLSADLSERDTTLDGMLSGDRWVAQLEGMTVMRRRFRNVFEGAKIRVNSGRANQETGEWIGKPTEIVTTKNPGIYVLEWAEPKPLMGLAIKEIDGYRTAVDVYAGPDDRPIDIEEAPGENWRTVTTYTQNMRGGGANSLKANGHARYLEGFVNFGTVQNTRAVRLRIIQQWVFGAGRRADRGGSQVDHKRCAVYGVAPVEYIGGEAETAKVVTQRLAVYDAATRELLKEVRSPISGPMSIRSDGEIFAAMGSRIEHMKIQGDEVVSAGVLVPDGVIGSPRDIEFGPDDKLFVYDHQWPDRKQIFVFDRNGKFLNTIGKPGHPEPGIRDPSYIIEGHDMTVSDRGDVYVSYGYDNPRRTIHFKSDGTFVQEFLGNTYYGGGGTLDRYDSSIGLYMDMIFKIDWKNFKSRLAGMKSYSAQETTMWGKGTRTHMAAVKVNGRKYHVTIPLVIRPVNSGGQVFLYDDETMTHRFVAAVGSCDFGYVFSTPEFIELLDGKSPGGFTYIFADRNGDGKAQPDEVEIEPKPRGFYPLGRFNRDLSIMGGTVRYEVEKFLPDGTPIYHRVPVKAPGGFLRLNNGNYFSYAGDALHGNGYNLVVTPEGKEVWRYRASFDVSGLYIPGSRPGAADNQFAVIGHEVEERGDLGEFFVIHSNTGQWNAWTADGLLVGPVLRHVGDPKARRYGNDHTPGAVMTGLTAGQEHMHGFFCKREDTGKYHLICGDDAATIIEVRGFDRYKRFATDITVTPAMYKATREWEADRVTRNIYSRSPTLECYRRTPVLNGQVSDHEWGEEQAQIGWKNAGTFRAVYDDANLYLAWTALRAGRLANGGRDLRRFFRTGSCVDVQIETDPDADPKRREPAKGDIRLLITAVRGTPRVVLYRPVAPGAPASDAWSVTTTQGGTVEFGQVKELTDVQVKFSDQAHTYTVEAAIPFRVLGIEAKPGLVLKIDAGILASDDGKETTARTYWANEMAVGTPDEATEARMEPHLWGYLRFHGKEKSVLETLMDGETPEVLEKRDIEDLFDDIEGDL